MRELNHVDRGTTITLHVGEKIRLTLNATSGGYAWSLSDTLRHCRIEQQQSDLASGNRPGGQVQRHWVVTAVSAGEERLRMVSSRSWDPDPQNDATFDLTIRVAP